MHTIAAHHEHHWSTVYMRIVQNDTRLRTSYKSYTSTKWCANTCALYKMIHVYAYKSYTSTSYKSYTSTKWCANKRALYKMIHVYIKWCTNNAHNWSTLLTHMMEAHHSCIHSSTMCMHDVRQSVVCVNVTSDVFRCHQWWVWMSSVMRFNVIRDMLQSCASIMCFNTAHHFRFMLQKCTIDAHHFSVTEWCAAFSSLEGI